MRIGSREKFRQDNRGDGDSTCVLKEAMRQTAGTPHVGGADVRIQQVRHSFSRLRSALCFAVLMDFGHDRIPKRVVRQGPGGAQDACASWQGWYKDLHLDLDRL